VRRLTESIKMLQNGISCFTAERTKQTSTNQGLREDAMRLLNATQDLKASNTLLKRETVGFEMDYLSAKKERDEQLVEFNRLKKLESDESIYGNALQETLNAMRTHCTNLENERNAYRGQAKVLNKRTLTTLARLQGLNNLQNQVTVLTVHMPMQKVGDLINFTLTWRWFF
jgi:hypothetical protein